MGRHQMVNQRADPQPAPTGSGAHSTVVGAPIDDDGLCRADPTPFPKGGGKGLYEQVASGKWIVYAVWQLVHTVEFGALEIVF